MSAYETTRCEYYGAATGAIVDNCFHVLSGSGKTDGIEIQHILPLKPSGKRRLGVAVPTPRVNIVAAAVGETIYTVAGALNSGDASGPCTVVEALDTRNDRWHTCASLPAQRVKPGLAAIGHTLYALGGREDDADAATIFAYDTRRDVWNESGELPYGARHGAACAADGIVYYGGGFTAQPSRTFQRAFVMFDPQVGDVKPLADMPEPRTAHALVASGGAVYALGGVDTDKRPTATVFRYDIVSDEWSACRKLASARAVFACDISGSKISLAGGWKQMGRESNSTDEDYIV